MWIIAGFANQKLELNYEKQDLTYYSSWKWLCPKVKDTPTCNLKIVNFMINNWTANLHELAIGYP